MTTLNDNELGVLIYDGAWICSQKAYFDNEKINIVFQAFEEENISSQQKELYFFVMDNFEKIVSIAKNCLIDKTEVIIHTLFFDRFNAYGFLGDLESDEHGIAIKFTDRNLKPQIGEQDILI